MVVEQALLYNYGEVSAEQVGVFGTIFLFRCQPLESRVEGGRPSAHDAEERVSQLHHETLVRLSQCLPMVELDGFDELLKTA